MHEGSQESHSDQPSSTNLLPILGMVDSGTRNLLKSIAGPSRAAAESGGNYPEHTPSPEPLDPLPLGGWGLFEANEITDLAMSSEQQGVALIAQSLLDRFDELSVGSADEGAEWSEIDEDEVPEPTLAGKQASLFVSTMDFTRWFFTDGDDHAGNSEPPLKRARNLRKDDSLDPSAKWFPWRDKIVSKLSRTSE